MAGPKSDNICRLCLASAVESTGIYLIDIFSQPPQWSLTIATAIMECAPVNIATGDGLPVFICSPCFDILTIARRFWKLCIQSDTVLHNELKKTDISKDVGLETASETTIDDATLLGDVPLECSGTSPPSVNTKNKIQCDICKMYFRSRRALSLHDQRTHKVKPLFKCEICNKSFILKTRYDLHMASHDPLNDVKSKESYHCELCDQSFTFKGKYYVHLNTHKVVYQCDMCGQSFTYRSKYFTHMKTHVKSGEVDTIKPHKCGYCEKTFKTQREMKIHERVHTGERPYVCDVCGKAFATLSTFRCHKNIHSGERPFECEVCGVRRISADELKRHMRVHSDKFLYKCDICGKEFKWSSNKVKHMRRHRGERNYKCNYCGKQFYDTYKLKEHQVVHTGERPYSCIICGRTFQLSSHLRKHNDRYHKI